MYAEGMKKTFFRYFIMPAILVLSMVLTVVPVSKTVQAKTKVKSVTLIKGKKKIYKINLKKTGKVKIKYSKKGIAGAALKKNKKMGHFIQITGKKKGKTTITVKIYKTKKKYRTYKYRVTVKTGIPEADVERKESSSGNSAGKTGQTKNAAAEKEIDTGYSYELQVLSCGGKSYGCSTSYKLTDTSYSISASNGFTVLYIKTQDPDLEDARLYSDKSMELKNMSLPPTEDYPLNIYKYQYKDIHYLNYNETANLNRVSGGYICSVKFSQRDEIGINNITIKKKTGSGDVPIKGAAFQLEVLDPDPSENQFLDKMISEVPEPSQEDINVIRKTYPKMTDDSAAVWYKMDVLMHNIRSNWRYYSSGAFVQENVWWEYDGKVGTVDCLMTTYIMMRFADKSGLDSRASYAGYLNHYYATITIDGEDYSFDACPTAAENDNFTWDYIL